MGKKRILNKPFHGIKMEHYGTTFLYLASSLHSFIEQPQSKTGKLIINKHMAPKNIRHTGI